MCVYKIRILAFPDILLMMRGWWGEPSRTVLWVASILHALSVFPSPVRGSTLTLTPGSTGTACRSSSCMGSRTRAVEDSLSFQIPTGSSRWLSCIAWLVPREFGDHRGSARGPFPMAPCMPSSCHFSLGALASKSCSAEWSGYQHLPRNQLLSTRRHGLRERNILRFHSHKGVGPMYTAVRLWALGAGGTPLEDPRWLTPHVALQPVSWRLICSRLSWMCQQCWFGHGSNAENI